LLDVSTGFRAGGAVWEPSWTGAWDRGGGAEATGLWAVVGLVAVVGSEALALVKLGSPEVLSPTTAAGVSVAGDPPDLLNLGVWLLLFASLCELYGLLVQFDGCVVLQDLVAMGADALCAAPIKLPCNMSLVPWLSGARVDFSQDMFRGIFIIGRWLGWKLRYGELLVGIEVESRFLTSWKHSRSA
jgi:hypothetical protein